VRRSRSVDPDSPHSSSQRAMPNNALTRRASYIISGHSPTRRRKMCSPRNACDWVDPFKAGNLNDANDWVKITEPDPFHGFEQVENLDFNQLQNSLDQLETSVRLLGRTSGLTYPQFSEVVKPVPLRPSVYECLRRSGPNVAEVALRDAQHTKQVPEELCEPIEITVKHESESGQMKLSLVGKRDEPVTIRKVKEAMVAELGDVNTSEFGFILKSGDMTALRLDYDVIRPSGKKRQFELVVRGIDLPRPKDFEQQLFQRPERLTLSPLSISRVSFFQLQDDGDLSPALSIKTDNSWQQVEAFELRLPLAPPVFSMAQEVEYFVLTPPASRPGQACLRDIEAFEHCFNQDLTSRLASFFPDLLDEPEEDELEMSSARQGPEAPPALQRESLEVTSPPERLGSKASSVAGSAAGTSQDGDDNEWSML